MAEKVKVKLRACCLVDGIREPEGKIVELPELADDGEPFAVLFGDIVKEAGPSEAKEKK